MRVFVYEYASGGGLALRGVPASLAREGAAMRAALVADLSALGHQIVTTADARRRPDLPPGVEIVDLPADDRARNRVLDRAIRAVDAVWLIAPETDRCLERLAARVERQHRTLLGPGADAIRHASDKARLPRRLAALGLRHPTTRTLGRGVDPARVAEAIGYPIVLKPARGAGSHGVRVAARPGELRQAAAPARRATRDGRVIMQEHVRGAAASVSLLADGRGGTVALAVNSQTLGSSFSYRGGRTPFDHPLAPRAAAAALAVCQSLEGLRGYVGVDVIVTDTDVVVIEVNPRVTTAYLGIRAAVDGNVAALALSACAGRLPSAPLVSRRVHFSSAGRILCRETARAERGAA